MPNNHRLMTRRGFMAGAAGGAVAAALLPRAAEARFVVSAPRGPVRHAHFQLAVPETAVNLPVDGPGGALGPAGALVFAQAEAYLLWRGAGATVAHTTLQHDAAEGGFARQVVLSVRYADGSTAVFSSAKRHGAESRGTIHFLHASATLAPRAEGYFGAEALARALG